MKPIRVILISHAYSVPIAREKAEALGAFEGLDLTLFFPSHWREGSREYHFPEGEPKGSSYRVRTGRVLFSGRIGGHFYLTGLLRTLREIEPDLVHLEEEPWSAVAAQVLLFRRILGSHFRLIVFSWENIHREFGFPYREFERATLRGAAFLIAGNEGARRVLEAKGFSSQRIALLHQLGVNPQEFSPGKEPQREDFRVIFAGRLVAQKGIETLLRAVTELPQRVKTIVLGEGPLRQKLQGLAAELGLQYRVEFLGSLDHSDVPGVLRRCHALVLPSLTTPDSVEQFGHVLIEAMSCGVPVVGSTSGAIPEVIGDAGLVFPEGDSRALALALRSLLEDKALWRRLAERGRRRVLERYTWDRLAEETISIYKRCLEPEA